MCLSWGVRWLDGCHHKSSDMAALYLCDLPARYAPDAPPHAQSDTPLHRLAVTMELVLLTDGRRPSLLNSFERRGLWRRPAAWRGLGHAALAGWLLLAGGVLQAQLAVPPGRPGNALPSLGDGLELAAAAERRLGDRIAMSIYRDPDYLDDPVLGDYLQGIWTPLMAAARARGELGPELEDRFAWEVLLVRDRNVNAFALPGGYLGVHTGLIAVVSNGDELAAVLAHELSHVTQRHISRLMTKQQQQTPWVIGAMILGVLAASKSPDAANAAIVGGQALAAQGQLNFSRDMEREADRIGFGVMTDAGFEGRGVSGMFEKLQQAARLNDNGSFPYLRSHPLTTERIAEARARLQTGESAAAPQSNPAGALAPLHAMMSARARVLGSPGVDDLRSMLADGQRAAAAPVTEALLPAWAGRVYGAALAASRLREHAAALALAAKLEGATMRTPRAGRTAQLLTIELATAAGQPAAAAVKLSVAGSRAELLVQGRALLAVGRVAELAEALQTWVVTHPKDAQAWQLLSEALSLLGEPTRAIRADAESRVAQLDYAAALDRLKAAQEMLRSGKGGVMGRNAHIEASIIDTRTRQVAALIREQSREDKADR
jgi:predicted Zn-dependent protease